MTTEPSGLLIGTLIVLTAPVTRYEGAGLYARIVLGCALILGIWYVGKVSK